MKERENFHSNTNKGDVNILRPPRLLPAIRRQNHKSRRARFELQLWMRLVDLNCNLECGWLIELYDNELSNNKLSDNNLASELEEIVIFMNKSLTITTATAPIKIEFTF